MTKGAQQIPRQPPGGQIPLSFAQRRLWFMEQLEPGHIDYNRSFATRLAGRLDPEALRQSLDEVVRRHSVLRTSFPAINGTPIQQVNPPRPVNMPLIDLSRLPAPERESAATRLAGQLASRPFDLESDLPIRAEIIRLDEEQHVLAVTTHHIVFDGFSESIFLREMSSFYASARTAADPGLSEPVIQFGDYAAWERERATRGAFDEQLAFWRTTLSDLSPRPGLPTLEGQAFPIEAAAGRERQLLSDSLSASIREFCRQRGVTPFMLFASVYVLMLQRLSGSDDIVIGLPVSGRRLTELENLIGMFVNTLPLRTDLSGAPTFAELLGRVRTATVEALGHQEVPFERLVEAVQPDRSLTHPPIFDFMINSHVFHQPRLSFGDLEVEAFPLPELSTPYPLTFYIHSEADQFILSMAYQTAKFSADQVDRLLHQIVFLLEQVQADPDRAIAAYSLVDSSSHSWLPDLASAIREVEYPDVISMTLEWVARDPTAVAVITGGRTHSFADLWHGSVELAESLARGDMQRGQVVAIVGRRSFELVVSMLGVLMAGGVILLIDPDWPRIRVEAMLDRSRARHVLLTAGWGRESLWLRERVDLSVHSLVPGPVQSEKAPSERSLELARRPPAPSDPAYIFFTSGTTGHPEGVLGSHKGLSHFLTWQRDVFGIGPGDRCAQLSGLSFDAILHDIFLPLISGSAVCLPDPSLSSASPEVPKWLERAGVTYLHSVPSLVESWLIGRSARVPLGALRWLFLAGEPLHASLVRKWRNMCPRAGGVVNLYGPTETTLVKSYYIVPQEPVPGVQPLGLPLPGTQIFVLGPRAEPCGVGEPGEIVIRTPYRTLGYLTKDSSRAGNFIPNPRSREPDDLLYRTGDRGYYRSDGSLGFLGRIDHQVKIHGTRVEPDGVAAVLSRQPGVLACAVAADKDDRGNDRLTAYVVSESDDVTPEMLRKALGRELTPAMIPTGFVFLENLPITSNGKVDREALRRLAAEHVPPQVSSVPPRDRLERQLVRTWERLLGVRPIGVRDDFFDRGGHSLLAVRMFVEVEKATKKRLPVRAIFDAPTIEKLAALIRSESWTPPETQVVAIQPQGKRPPVFWVHAAGGHVLSYRRMARYLGPDQPVYALQGINLEEDRLGEADVEDMATRYVADLQKVQPAGPYFVGGLSFGGIVAWEIAQRLRARGHTVALLILLDTHGPRYPRPSLLRRTALGLRQRIEFHGGNLSALRPREKLTYLVERGGILLPRLVRRGWSAAQTAWYMITSPTPRAVKRAYRGDRSARMRYTPKPFAGPIALFRAQSQPAAGEYPQMGWEGLVKGRMDIYEVPGAHVSIMAEPHLRVLASKLDDCLKAAQEAADETRLRGAE